MKNADKMNNQDYIRAGVELADGWELDTAGAIHSPFCERWFTIPPEMLSQPHKAALAAQLVEQVDSLKHIAVIPEKGMTRIWSDKTGECLSEERSPDRNINTIKAIVDSKVLEKGENE